MVNPVMGPQLMTAGAIHLGTVSAQSTTQAASAVDANPQANPCKKRPASSGYALCIFKNTRHDNPANKTDKIDIGLRPKWFDKRPKMIRAITAPIKYTTELSAKSEYVNPSTD